MKNIRAYQMIARDKPFEQVTLPFPELAEGEALVEVAGCGVCHTDLSFWHYGVPTRHELPLVLGHEISGTVLEGPSRFKGKPVVVPAVLPCGQCELCGKGRSNICQNQKMPGNDFNGGFSSHVVVPAQYLAPVDESVLATHTLAELSVIADAVSTPYQVIVKSDLKGRVFLCNLSEHFNQFGQVFGMLCFHSHSHYRFTHVPDAFERRHALKGCYCRPYDCIF